MICNTYYGGFRTRTFADIFPSFEVFKAAYDESALKIDFESYLTLGTESTDVLTLDQVYYMLYAHYGNSHIAMSDETQFKYYILYITYFSAGTSELRSQTSVLQPSAAACDETVPSVP